MKGYKNKIKQRIENYCTVHFDKLSKDHMKLGKGLFNHRCQYNAVQQVKEGGFKEVYLCVCCNSSNYPVVHFINKDKDGIYVDNTLGWKYELYDYYIIKKLDESEFESIDKILNDTKADLLNKHSNPLIRWFMRIDYSDIGI